MKLVYDSIFSQTLIDDSLTRASPELNKNLLSSLVFGLERVCCKIKCSYLHNTIDPRYLELSLTRMMSVAPLSCEVTIAVDNF